MVILETVICGAVELYWAIPGGVPNILTALIHINGKDKILGTSLPISLQNDY